MIQNHDSTTCEQISGYIGNQAVHIGNSFGVIQQVRDEHQPKSVPRFNAIIRIRQKSEQVSPESITCPYRKPGQLQRAAGLRGDKIAQCCSTCGVGVVGNKIGRFDAKAARVATDWKRDMGALIN